MDKISTDKAPKPVGLYPHARKVGNLLFLSGVGPREKGTKKIGYLVYLQFLTQFDTDIRNVFKEGELDEKSNMQKMHIANSDKPVAYYNLDVIISVGYRVKSKQGTQFRQWATQRLKDFLVKGYVLN